MRSRFIFFIASFFFSSLAFCKPNPPSSWEQALKEKTALIKIYWYESKPFIFRGVRGNIQGLEFEIMEGFKHYLKEKRNIKLTTQWIEGKSFFDTYNEIALNKAEGTF